MDGWVVSALEGGRGKRGRSTWQARWKDGLMSLSHANWGRWRNCNRTPPESGDLRDCEISGEGARRYRALTKAVSWISKRHVLPLRMNDATDLTAFPGPQRDQILTDWSISSV